MTEPNPGEGHSPNRAPPPLSQPNTEIETTKQEAPLAEIPAAETDKAVPPKPTPFPDGKYYLVSQKEMDGIITSYAEIPAPYKRVKQCMETLLNLPFVTYPNPVVPPSTPPKVSIAAQVAEGKAKAEAEIAAIVEADAKLAAAVAGVKLKEKK